MAVLHSERVRQLIDAAQEERVELVRDLLLVESSQPLAMVRRRLPPNGKSAATRGAILLLHGFGQNRRTFNLSRRSFANYLAAAGFDVYAVDLRGHGRSRAFGASRPASLDEYIREDLPAAVREVLEISGERRLFLLGHSLGGLIAYAGSPSMADRVRGIVTIGSPMHFGRGTFVLRLLAMLGHGLAQVPTLRGKNPVLPVRELGRQLARRRLFWDTRLNPFPVRGWHPGSVEPDILEEYLTEAFDRASLSVLLMMLRWATHRHFQSEDGRIDYEERFASLNLPLLVLAGEHDRLAPPASCQPAYDRSQSTDRTFTTYPMGHIDLICGREAPQTVWPTIRDWLVRH